MNQNHLPGKELLEENDLSSGVDRRLALRDRGNEEVPCWEPGFGIII